MRALGRRLRMHKLILLVAMCSVWIAPNTNGQSTDWIQITEPRGGAVVEWRPFFRGTVASPQTEVWVIIHPVATGEYWVQPRPTVLGDGTWQSRGYVGRPGDIDRGNEFEVMAIANPAMPLEEGNVFEFWPDADHKSSVILVLRK